MASTVSNGWQKLQEHRRKAARFPLAVLIWGPADNGTVEYQTRRRIREILEADGHDVRFSEDLAAAPDALPNPIDDETLQADSADVIVLIYGSMGTQSEHDIILSNAHVCSKAIIAIASGLDDLIDKALASKTWRSTRKHARMIRYEPSDMPEKVVEQVKCFTDEIRQACYVRHLRAGGLLP